MTTTKEQQAEAAADEYLKTVGTHDKPQFTKHDFVQGHLAGASRPSLEEVMAFAEQWAYRGKKSSYTAYMMWEEDLKKIIEFALTGKK